MSSACEILDPPLNIVTFYWKIVFIISFLFVTLHYFCVPTKKVMLCKDHLISTFERQKQQQHRKHVITVNEVGEGYVFTPVCLSTGGVCLSACWDTTPLEQRPHHSRHPHPTPNQEPQKQTPPKQTPPQTRHPLQSRPSPGPGTPPNRHPPDQAPPQQTATVAGRYASYWNAFLFRNETWVTVPHNCLILEISVIISTYRFISVVFFHKFRYSTYIC